MYKCKKTKMKRLEEEGLNKASNYKGKKLEQRQRLISKALMDNNKTGEPCKAQCAGTR